MMFLSVVTLRYYAYVFDYKGKILERKENI